MDQILDFNFKDSSKKDAEFSISNRQSGEDGDFESEVEFTVQTKSDEPSFPCARCMKETETDNTRAIKCSKCSKWIHIECEGLLETTFLKHTSNSDLLYICTMCTVQGNT